MMAGEKVGRHQSIGMMGNLLRTDGERRQSRQTAGIMDETEIETLTEIGDIVVRQEVGTDAHLMPATEVIETGLGTGPLPPESLVEVAAGKRGPNQPPLLLVPSFQTPLLLTSWEGTVAH